ADDAAKISSLEKFQAMIQFQMDGTIIDANDNFLDLMGYSREEVKGKHHNIFVDKEYAKSTDYKDFWKSLNEGNTESAEFARYTKDGQKVWIQASYNPILNNHGKPIRVVKYASDITEAMRKRQEAEILSLVANNTDNSVIITDTNERIEYVNPGFTNMTGYSLEEVMGKRPGNFLQGKATDAETKRDIREKIKACEPFYDEILNYHKNGEPYWISLSINPVFDKQGKVERFISIQANITSTKEQQLKFQGCIEAIESYQGMVEYNTDGIVQRVNGNFLHVIDYNEEDVIGKHHRMFMDKAESAEASYQQFWQELRSGNPQVGEFKRITKGGKEVWMQASYNPIKNAFGEVTGVVNYSTDITEQVLVKRENERGIVECKDVLQEVANGNLMSQMTQTYEGDFNEIKEALNMTTQKLISIVQQVKISGSSVSSASSEISSGSVDLSSRTEQQASSLEETAASMEELTGTVAQNSENASEANQLAEEARQVAEEGGRVVGSTVEAMSSIESSSQKISDIIGVIDEIAFQTNLLALNAAVEAARAGEAGKGFAVVASEVRSLAGRSASASKEIKGLIEESSHQVKNGVKLADEAGERLQAIVESVQNVTNLVADIAMASKEQSTGINEVSAAVSQMDEMTQQNAALVQENTASAQTLMEQAKELERLMSFFNIGGAQETSSGVSAADIIASAPVISYTPSASPHAVASGQKPGANGADYDIGWEEF
ncbi:MAG: PAS domain-containing protein, partial [Sphaerospermopsis sp. SIO1G2]|nr:PAS domain-containing protein [Sphaerospermopsis sp. SIO1G2]